MTVKVDYKQFVKYSLVYKVVLDGVRVWS